MTTLAHTSVSLLFAAGLFAPGNQATRPVASGTQAARGSAPADQAACDAIRAADVKTGSDGVHMTQTGYAFAKDTPMLYALGDQTCRHLRDEVIDNQPAAVYREQYASAKGSTDATMWISKTSGRLLREEQDGDIRGKGKGHISYRWPAKK